MIHNTYEIGNVIQTICKFHDTESGGLVDPGTVQLETKGPSGVVASYQYPEDPQIVKKESGVYSSEIYTAESGWYSYRWSGAGGLGAAKESTFLVKAGKILR